MTPPKYFAPKAGYVFDAARLEARQDQLADYLKPEHLLAGMSQVASCVAHNVLLDRLKMTTGEMIKLFKKSTGYNIRPVLNYNQHTAEVFELARREAESMHDAKVGTRHLLLSILLHEKNAAANHLRKLGFTLENTRRDIEQTTTTS